MAAASNGMGFHGFRMSALAGVACVLSIAALSAGCGPQDLTGPTGVPTTASGTGGDGGGGAGGGGEGGAGGGEPCADGDTRACKVSLGTHGNVTSCFQGEQRCEAGAWGPCAEPSAPPPPPQKLPDGTVVPDQHTRSLSNATACNTDPCDPSCQTFDEVPGAPIGSPPEILIAPWDTGNYGNIPPNIAGQGTTEPCKQGSDCQFDQYCNNPSSGTCAHSKCVTGSGLSSSCDPCVASVCGANPGCCTTPIGTTAGSTCSHDLCVTGAPLKNGSPACDPCVATICSPGNPQFSFCCNQVTGQWTGECVQQVQLLCGKSCNTGTWTQTCVDLVNTQCGAYCLEDTTAPACAHDKCYQGGPLSGACDPCVADVCAADPFCCAGGWDGKCLQEVATICGETCPEQGQCLPWLPTQVNPKCTGIDLTVGVGCTNGGVQQVPVCNHGQSQAPAGLSVVVFPPAPPDVIPDNTSPYSGEPIVYTTDPIDPGDCVNVALPAGTVDGSQIVVNLKNAPSYDNSECQESNNFSVWSDATGACATPSCAGASASAKLKKVKLFVTVDKSFSQTYVMAGLPGSPTRWSQLTDALKEFIQAPASDDLGLWLRFWPYNVNGNCPSGYPSGCSSVAGCKVANADVADLASAANETTLINAINAVSPLGQTPMYPALDGALQAATTFQQANPDYVAAVVMVTDGDPSQCTTSLGGMSDLTASYYNGYGIRTYMIGIAEVNQTFIEVVAGAGGGKSFFIDYGDNIPVKDKMLSALDTIKQDFVSCTLALPNQDIFDPNGATFTYTPGVGAPINLVNVGSAAACGAGNGWYYDDPANPSSITLCPATCTAVKADTNGQLELSIDCVSQYLPYDQPPEVYEASCPPGTVPQWGFLAHDTTTPGDSSVEFRVSTSKDGVVFDPLPVTPTAVASAGSEVCAMGGPPPCPVSLYTALNGLPAANRKYLQLAMKILPTSDTNQTPTVNDWQVTYSCPDAE